MAAIRTQRRAAACPNSVQVRFVALSKMRRMARRGGLPQMRGRRDVAAVVGVRGADVRPASGN